MNNLIDNLLKHPQHFKWGVVVQIKYNTNVYDVVGYTFVYQGVHYLFCKDGFFMNRIKKTFDKKLLIKIYNLGKKHYFERLEKARIGKTNKKIESRTKNKK